MEVVAALPRSVSGLPGTSRQGRLRVRRDVRIEELGSFQQVDVKSEGECGEACCRWGVDWQTAWCSAKRPKQGLC